MVLAPLFLLAAAATFEESFRAGLLALQRNDLTAARTGLESASKTAPGNARVWVALAQTYRKLGDSRKAVAAAAKAEALGGKDAVVMSTLAMYFDEAGDPLRSADALAKYAALVPANADAREKAEAKYFAVAQSLLQQSKFSEALTILQAATARLKDSAQLQLGLGVAAYGLRRFDEAATAFLRTIELNPEIPQPYMFLGKFLDQIPARVPDVAKKFIEFEKAHPEDFAGYYLHAKALNLQAIEPEHAAELLKKALALNDREAGVHFELGAVFDRTRRYAEAAPEFERAAELAPSDPATHYRLSRVYDRLGKSALAQQERDKHAVLEKAARESK